MILRFCTSKHLILAGLFLFAGLWVGLMGQVGIASRHFRAYAGIDPAHDDGSIDVAIKHLDKQEFDITLSLRITNPREGHKILSGLTRDQIEVRENGIPVQFKEFIPAGQGPVRVCLVMDYSNSMRNRKIAGAKAAASALVDQLRNDTDYLGLYSFKGRSDGEELLPMGRLNARSRKRVRDAIQETPLGGGTPMYRTMLRALKDMGNVSGRRVMIVLTDGMDTSGRRKAKLEEAIIDASKQARIPLYTVSLQGGRSNENAMRRMASETNGDYLHAPEPEHLKSIFINIGESLQDEYTVAYRSPAPVENGISRKVVVAVRSGDSGAMAETGYTVPGVIAVGSPPAMASEQEAAPEIGSVFLPIFLPLTTLLGLLLGIPYVLWMRGASTSLLSSTESTRVEPQPGE